MKILRKLALKVLVGAGLIDKVGHVKGPLARQRAVNKVRPNVSGLVGVIIQKYKGKNTCMVQVQVNGKSQTYAANMSGSATRTVVGGYASPVQGGFSVGDEVVLTGWDGLSTSVVEVQPLDAKPTAKTIEDVRPLLDQAGKIVEKYDNFFCKVEVGGLYVVSKYKGVTPPIVGTQVRISSTLGVQTECVPIFN